MVYKRYNKTYVFRKFKTIHSYGNDIRTNFINVYTEFKLKNLKVKQDHKVTLNFKKKLK